MELHGVSLHTGAPAQSLLGPPQAKHIKQYKNMSAILVNKRVFPIFRNVSNKGDTLSNEGDQSIIFGLIQRVCPHKSNLHTKKNVPAYKRMNGFQLMYCLFVSKRIFYSNVCYFLIWLHRLVGICNELSLSEGERLVPKIERGNHILRTCKRIFISVLIPGLLHQPCNPYWVGQVITRKWF